MMKTITEKILANGKGILFSLIFIMTMSVNATAQRFVYVDMDYILENLPAYAQAQESLDQISETWRTEIALKMEDVETSYKRFQAEQVLMNEKMKTEKITEIENKEKDLKSYQREKFGPNGDLFKKRQELVKPIQNKIYKQIELLAAEKSYDFIFDKSSGVQMLFANKKYDKSALIIAAVKKN